MEGDRRAGGHAEHSLDRPFGRILPRSSHGARAWLLQRQRHTIQSEADGLRRGRNVEPHDQRVIDRRFLLRVELADRMTDAIETGPTVREAAYATGGVLRLPRRALLQQVGHGCGGLRQPHAINGTRPQTDRIHHGAVALGSVQGALHDDVAGQGVIAPFGAMHASMDAPVDHHRGRIDVECR
jgi:hypothetical protein